MRKPIIAANWKMHKTLSEAQQFMQEINGKVPSYEIVESVVCSTPLFLQELVKAAQRTDVKIGAQTMHYEEQGAFTGEVSPVALHDLGVTYVILGHSERREMFNETDESVNKKVLAAFKHHLLPIVCCGETLQQREAGETFDHVANQIRNGLKGLTEEQIKQTVIAYEPIWAIGTGKNSTAEDANEVCGHIRQVVAELFTPQAAEAVRIQYGGSVKPENVAEYMAKEHIDGALVGGASLVASSYLQLLEACVHD